MKSPRIPPKSSNILAGGAPKLEPSLALTADKNGYFVCR